MIFTVFYSCIRLLKLQVVRDDLSDCCSFLSNDLGEAVKKKRIYEPAWNPYDANEPSLVSPPIQIPVTRQRRRLAKNCKRLAPVLLESKSVRKNPSGLFPLNGIWDQNTRHLVLAFEKQYDGYTNKQSEEYHSLLDNIMTHYMSRTKYGNEQNAGCNGYKFSYRFSQDGLYSCDETMGSSTAPRILEGYISDKPPRDWTAEMEDLEEIDLYGIKRRNMLAPTGGLGEAEGDTGQLASAIIKPRMVDYMRKPAHYGPGIDYFPGTSGTCRCHHP